MRRILASTAALAALLLACGKSEPAPAPPTPQPAAQGGTPDKAPEPAKTEADKPKSDNLIADQKAPSPTNPSAAPTPPGPALPALAQGSPPPERAALTLSSVAAFPTDVVAVGGTPSLAALVAAFSSQAARVPGVQLPPDPLPMAIQTLQQKAGIDLSWLDTSKPLRFAVPDPKKYKDGIVLLLPEKAGAAFDPKSLKDAKLGGGHLASLKVGEDREIFIDRPVEGHVLVTSHGDLAKALEPFVKELAAWTPKDPLVVDTSVENLVRIYAEELKNAKEMVGAMGGSIAQDPSMAQKIGPMMKVAESGFALLEGTARASFALDPSGDFPRLGVAFKALPGSPVEGFIKKLSGRKVALAGLVPADAWLVLGADVEGLSYMSDAQKMVEAITGQTTGPMALDWSADDKKTLLALFTRAQELQGTQSVSWLRQDGARPFVFEAISDAKDGVGLQQAAMDIGDFLYKKLWGAGRKAMLAQGAPAAEVPEAMSFKDFLGLVSKNSAPIGVGASVSEGASKAGTKTPGLEVSIDWSRLPLRGNLGKIGELVGPNVGLSMAGEGQHFAFAFGPNASERTARLLDGAATETAPSDPWLAKAQNGAFFVLLRPARLLRVLVDLVPDLAEKRAVIGGLPDDAALVTGSSDGSSLVVEATFPARIISALVTQ